MGFFVPLLFSKISPLTNAPREETRITCSQKFLFYSCGALSFFQDARASGGQRHDITFDTFPIWSDRDPTIQLGGAGKPVFDRLRNLVSDVEAVPQWVSSYQFLVHFQQYTGTVGPTRTVHMGTTARPHCWIQVLSEGNLEIAPVRRRPAGAAIAIWIRCYWMRISPVMVSGIDVLFLSHVGRPITKVGRQLEGIPLPTRQGWCS